MKKNYETPQVEIIQIEIEDAILNLSGVTNSMNYGQGGGFGDIFDDADSQTQF